MDELERHMHEWVTKQERMNRVPDTLILPGSVCQLLRERGYETDEQVVSLIRDILAKDS